MAFQITIDDSDEFCDICKQRNAMSGSRPMIILQQSTGGRTTGDRNYIFAHLDEFKKKLAKEEKRAEAQNSGTTGS